MKWKMRRSRQQLNEQEALEVLDQATSGVLSLVDPDGLPYGVPLSFVREEDHLYFHCAMQGRKLECIKSHPVGSFCVIGADEIVPEKFTTVFLSAMVSGPLCLVQEDDEKRKALLLLTAKYCSNIPEELHQAEIGGAFGRTAVLRLDIQSLSGKEGRERMEARLAKQKMS